MALRVFSHFPTDIVIDGETIPIKVTRLTPQQSVAFNRDFARSSQQAAPAPPDETPEQCAAREEQEALAADQALDFVVKSISSYIAVEPGHMFEDDAEESFQDGATLVRLYGARDDILQELLIDIFFENKLNTEQKTNRKQRLAPFVPTPADVADRMMADVTDQDLVVDPGCGSGRLCIAAAQRGARARGYDIDPKRILEAKEAAAAAGVESLCTFELQDAVTVDFRDATVVALYLLSSGCAKLRPVLLEQLPEGARLVSHAFTMGADWTADATEHVSPPEGESYAHAGARWIYRYSIDQWRQAHPAPRRSVPRKASGA